MLNCVLLGFILEGRFCLYYLLF